jgi:hypothetical protein
MAVVGVVEEAGMSRTSTWSAVETRSRLSRRSTRAALYRAAAEPDHVRRYGRVAVGFLGVRSDRYRRRDGTDTATDITAAQGDTEDGTIP